MCMLVDCTAYRDLCRFHISFLIAPRSRGRCFMRRTPSIALLLLVDELRAQWWG
jgi:hypothetical protein